ncbi:hypothetical protein TNCV_1358961 [Trichonephila clavipes]|nr:hypothetical protein TNCV_1358961 [Trichonephila clavipes]
MYSAAWGRTRESAILLFCDAVLLLVILPAGRIGRQLQCRLLTYRSGEFRRGPEVGRGISLYSILEVNSVSMSVVKIKVVLSALNPKDVALILLAQSYRRLALIAPK